MKNTITFVIALLMALQLPAKTIEKTYFFNDFQTQQIGDYHLIVAPGAYQTAKNGQALLPWYAAKFLLPPGEEIVSIEIIGSDQVQLAGNYLLIPKQYAQPISKGASGTFVKDESFYLSSEIYPKNQEEFFQTSFWGGHSIGMINYTPFEYIPSSVELSFYQQMTIVVYTQPTEKAQQALQLLSSVSKDPIKKFVENPEQINSYTYATTKTDDYDYLIITPNQYMEEFDTLVAHYLQRGLKTIVKSKEEILDEMAGQDGPEKIRNYIIQEYTEHSTKTIIFPPIFTTRH